MMGLFDWFRPLPRELPALPVLPKTVNLRGSFLGATMSRNVGFDTYLEPPSQEIKRDIVRLRAHSRDLAKNNAYAARYHAMVSTHVVGPDGMVLESGVTGNMEKPKQGWNDAIESAWEEWGKSASADGLLDWVALQQLIAQTVSIDGEALIRICRGYPNRFGFALELLDADQLDYSYSEPKDAQGNRCIMGIRMDKWGRPTAYRFYSAHPQDYEGRVEILWIPASEIIHVYSPHRAKACRGIPWTSPVMNQLSLLGRLFSAELNSAISESKRLGVIKSGVIDINDEGDLPLGDAISNAEAISTDESEFLGLDAGLDIAFAPSTHPNGAISTFSKTLLEGIAAGLSVSYHSLTMDVSQANYSSARVALLEERDSWMKLQRWYMDRVCEPVFSAFLESAIAFGAIKIPILDYKKAYSPIWWPRSWSWINPKDEATASITAISSGLSTYQAELGSQGLNWKKVLLQRKAEQDFIKELKLELDLGQKPAPPPPESGAPDPGNPPPTPETNNPPLGGGDNNATKPTA